MRASSSSALPLIRQLPADPVTVTVVTCAPPSIAQQPQSTVIREGEDATLTVAAAGTAPFDHQWFERASGDTSAPLFGENGDTLVVSPSETTRYWCRVTNECGSADSTSASVSVRSIITP